MKQSEKDNALSRHLPGVLQYHQTMLSDEVRNRALYQAIAASVTPETSFLDVGAGTGVWAIVAAKLGAKRVVAIEIEEALIPLIHKHAKENGVADKIEIIHGRSDDVKLKGKFDVIVSELFGSNALGDESVRSFIDVRERFLAARGTLIPQKLTLLAAPAFIPPRSASTGSGLDIKLSFFNQLQQNYGRNLPVAERDEIVMLAEPASLVDLDFRLVEVPPRLDDLTAEWQLTDIGKANAIVTFNRSTFSYEITLDSTQSPSWGVTVQEFDPFDAADGAMRFRVAYADDRTNWTVDIPSRPDLRPQSFGPVFAFSRTRMAHQMTPHKRFKQKKKAG